MRGKRLLSVLLHVAACSDSRGFDPSQCKDCAWNHDRFGDDFDKSGHCYMFRQHPPGVCPQRKTVREVTHARG